MLPLEPVVSDCTCVVCCHEVTLASGWYWLKFDLLFLLGHVAVGASLITPFFFQANW